MATGIVYLDVDDEITSAAARIRSSTNPRVALVVPYGSRIATSRMNFRLLSREAVVSNRRLSIVAGDAASRALAASAGLPVFASVAEYESANAEPDPAHDGSARRPGGAAVGAAVLPAPDGQAAREGDETVTGVGTGGPNSGPTSLAASETVAAIGPADHPRTGAAGSAGAAGAAVDADMPSSSPPSVRTRAGSTRPRPRRNAAAAGPTATHEPLAEDEPARPLARRTPVLVGAAILALAVIVVGVGAYLLLPAATIAITPRREPISVSLTVTADPSATTVDATSATIPAIRLDVPVQASQTFTTTGVKVVQTAATGQVTFSNYNPLAANSVPAGSIVSTEAGIRFKTLASVTVPAGTFVRPSVIPSTRTVAIEAVKPGTEGNVAANAIHVVPPGENPTFLTVNNDQPTAGGVKSETPQISQAEIDKALATLHAQLQSAFDDAIASGAGAPAGATVFPRTAVLGDATPSVNPQGLVGQAVPTYDLSLSADGNVIAVDPSPVRSLAESALTARVGPDHRLVSGSVQVQVGEGSVDETGTVSFDATARGQRIAVLDPNQLRALVKGRSAADAKAALAAFGDVRVDLWPSWVTTVTSLDPRLTIAIDESAASAEPSASAVPSAPVVRPSSSPRPSPSHSNRPVASASSAP